jgi:hypothetical protein
MIWYLNEVDSPERKYGAVEIDKTDLYSKLQHKMNPI